MKYGKFLTLIVLMAFSLPFTYGGCSGGGGGGDGGDPCDGPVPCLTKDWGDTYREFIDEWDNPVMVISDGTVFAIAGITYDEFGDPYVIALAGSVTKCHDGDLDMGAIDWNGNGNLDPGEELGSVSGEFNICEDILSIYDFVIDGEPRADFEATYVGKGILLSTEIQEKVEIQEKTKSQRNLLQELIQIM